MSDLPEFSKDDIESLKKTSTVLLYNDLVLDVTHFVHPGGPQLHLDNNGQDVTRKFDFIGHSHNAKRMIVHHAVGRIGTKQQAEEVVQKLIGTEDQEKHELLVKKLDLSESIIKQVEKMSYEEVCIFINFPKFVKEGQQLKIY
jgi:cytochrome b involved in lipid metabolism